MQPEVNRNVGLQQFRLQDARKCSFVIPAASLRLDMKESLQDATVLHEWGTRLRNIDYVRHVVLFLSTLHDRIHVIVLA